MARFNSGDIITCQINRITQPATYSTPGSYTWTVPAGITCATFELWGGGGGGGAKCCCDCYHQGQGGGAGQFISATFPVSGGTVYTLCVGPGGSYGSNTPATGYHYCCLGQAGAASYVTGGSITTLCAGGGCGGVNMCYTTCICSECGGQSTWAACALISGGTPSTVSCATNCGSWSTGNTPQNASRGYVGLWTDAQAYYHKSSAGGSAFSNGTVNTSQFCTAPTSFPACCFALPGTQMAGAGGQGAFSFCCSCISAGAGGNGLIIIRY